MRITITYTGSQWDYLLIGTAILDPKIKGIHILGDMIHPVPSIILSCRHVTVEHLADFSHLHPATLISMGECGAFIWTRGGRDPAYTDAEIERGKMVDEVLGCARSLASMEAKIARGWCRLRFIYTSVGGALSDLDEMKNLD
ncbi:hypothetical protein F5Y17DRAFT_52408 [Xylariaceae sp. FL0594]|nr:hypothetical protein F5Y17DRAFT_52408 [Xylariaceae sp. FL0594]